MAKKVGPTLLQTRSRHSARFRSTVKLASRRRDGAEAFLADPGVGRVKTRDALAGEIGREYLESATSGEEVGTELRDVVLAEEQGGPFVISTRRKEFAHDADETNPVDAEPAPFPAATAAALFDEPDADEPTGEFEP